VTFSDFTDDDRESGRAVGRWKQSWTARGKGQGHAGFYSSMAHETNAQLGRWRWTDIAILSLLFLCCDA
jgi:hypothetical protein